MLCVCGGWAAARWVKGNWRRGCKAAAWGQSLECHAGEWALPRNGFLLTGEGEAGSVQGRPTPSTLDSLHGAIPGITICVGLGFVDLAKEGDLRFPEFPFL